MSVTYISNNDLSVRLQSLKCCLGDKGMALASNLRLGIDCPVDIKEFNIASIAYDILSCTVTDLFIYDIVILEPFILGGLSNLEYTDLSINIPSESIIFSLTNVTPEDFLIAFTLAYPQYSYTIVPPFSRVFIYFKITGPCNVALESLVITSELGETKLIDDYRFSECIKNTYEYNNQNDANCLTINQIMSIFEYLEQYCCKCFPMYGELDNEPIITPL